MLPRRSSRCDFVFKMMNSVSKMMNFVYILQMMKSVSKVMNFALKVMNFGSSLSTRPGVKPSSPDPTVAEALSEVADTGWMVRVRCCLLRIYMPAIDRPLSDCI